MWEWKALHFKHPKIQQNEPVFHVVDKPGEWPEHVFWPKFEDAHGKGQHLCHALPTSLDQVGKRTIDSWESHCNDYESIDAFRSGADSAIHFLRTKEGK